MLDYQLEQMNFISIIKEKIITIHQKISNKLLNIKDSHELKYQKEINQNEEKTIIKEMKWRT